MSGIVTKKHKIKKVLDKVHCLIYNKKAVLQRGLVKWYDKGLQNL